MRLSLHLVLRLPWRLVHSRSVHSRSVHSRSVHSRSIHFVEYVVFQSCIVSRPYIYSLLDKVDDVIYTCLVSYPGNSTAVT